MKKKRALRRQWLVLTLEEKKVTACVLAMFALGCATQYYRATHPRPAPPPTAQEIRAAKRAQNLLAAKARSQRVAQATQPTAAESDESAAEAND